MKITAKLVVRVLLGLFLVVFGINKFLLFMPAMDMPEPASAFFGSIINTGYLFQFVGLVEVLAGLALLLNRFVPLALIIVAPVLVNILAFHLFLDPKTIIPGLVLTAMSVYLMFQYKPLYDPILSATGHDEA
ncbi:MAG: DoxX family membrane protein [Bacteroidota bacterium]